MAQAVSYLTFLPLILGYIYFSKLYKNTWNGKISQRDLYESQKTQIVRSIKKISNLYILENNAFPNSGVEKILFSGWSWECLEHWGLFFRLSIAGLFHVSIEWWSFEIGTFLTGMSRFSVTCSATNT